MPFTAAATSHAVANMNRIVVMTTGKGSLSFTAIIISVAVAVLIADDARFALCENVASRYTDRLCIVVALVYYCIRALSAVRHAAV